MTRRTTLRSIAICALTLVAPAVTFAGPTTAPSALLDAIRQSDWKDIPERMKLQYASVAVEPDQAAVAAWVDQYRSMEERFDGERTKAYEKAVRDTLILRDGGYFDLAMDGLADCYTLAKDKPGFVKTDWVVAMLDQAKQLATGNADAGDWLKARRIYINLSILEPTESKWTHSMEDMFRRVRYLSRYAPDSFAGTLQKEIEYRKVAKKHLIAATQPAGTQPATQPTAGTTDDANDSEEQIAQSLRTDWQQELAGIQSDMLREALRDAQQSYYRDVSYSQLLTGGLQALRSMATTGGMEKAFAKIGDEKLRNQFVDVIDESLKHLANKPADRDMIDGILNIVAAANLQTIDLPESVLVSEFADGAFATLDPFSSMIWPYAMEEFRTSTQGEFSGVGIQILEADGQIKVISPLEDSPALRAGIRAGDIITHIDGKTAKGITTMQAKKLITGLSGTPVTLTIKSPDDKVRDYTLMRSIIKVASIKGWTHDPDGGWEYLVDPEQKIAYVRLTNFTKESSNELDRAVEQINKEGARAMILDLRGNPGGLLTAATEVADKFLSAGKIVSTQSLRDATKESRIDAHPSKDDVKMPVVVLVNQYSASASEIVSGALKDLERATVIGERTYGKGSVQMLFPLNKQKAFLKLTTSHYYLPKGKCIHHEENATEWGVDPDLTVEVTPEQMRRVIDDRTELDVLRENGGHSEEQEVMRQKLLNSDLQLSAGIFVLRLQLAGAPAAQEARAN